MDPVQPSFTEHKEPIESASCCGCSHKFSVKKILGILGVFLVAIIIWQWINSPMVVTVNGIGEVSVPATNATVTTTISVNADSAQSAILAAKTRAQSIRELLKGSGISEGDIAESQITSYPAGLVTSGATGFQASLQISAKTVHVSTVGDLVAGLYAAGASLVEQPVLSVENQKDLEAQASAAALKDARSQISKIALKNLKLIRKVVALTEQTSSTTSTATTKADVITQQQNEQAAINGVFKIAKVVSVSYKLW